jgi:hypothetical protein
MHARTAAVAFILTLALGGATILFLRPKPADTKPSTISRPAAPPTPARMNLDDATAITIAGGDTSWSRSIIRKDASAPWTMDSWPVEPTRTRSVLRLLEDVTALEPVPDAPTPAGPTVTVSTPAGSTTFTIATIRVGGKVFVGVRTPAGTTSVVHADGALLDLFRPASIEAWRSGQPLDLLGREPDAVVIESRGERLELLRTGSGWALTKPVPVLAEPEEVRALLARCAQLTAQHLTGDPDDASLAAVRAPTALVRLSARTPEGAAVMRELAVGKAADAGASLFHVSATGSHGDTALGPMILTVSRADVEGLARTPAQLAARTSAPRTRPADVGIITMIQGNAELSSTKALAPMDANLPRQAVTLRRTLEGWTVARGNDVGKPADAPVAEIPGLILTAMCEAHAGEVAMGLPDTKKLRTIAVLQLASPGGAPLDVIAVGGITSDTGEQLITRVGSVWRVYAGDTPTDLLRRLRGLVPPEG